MSTSIRIFVLHRHKLFRDLVLRALEDDGRMVVIGATESHREADRWVGDAAANAAVVELDPDFATESDLRDLFQRWSAKRPSFAILGAGLGQEGVDLYVHKTDPGTDGDLARALGSVLGA